MHVDARGQKQNSFAVTSAMLGIFRKNARTRMEFLELIRLRSGVPGSSSAAEPGVCGRRVTENAAKLKRTVAPSLASSSSYTEAMRRLLAAGLHAASLAIPTLSQTQPRGAETAGAARPALTQSRSRRWSVPRRLAWASQTNLSLLRRARPAAIPRAGILIKLPPHRGPVTLTFDLHNRHTYSEEQVKAKPRVRQIHGDHRRVDDGQHAHQPGCGAERIPDGCGSRRSDGGGAGPGGVKAVAPTGTESITIMIPEREDQVSILGEKLTVERLDGNAIYTQAGRPIATSAT